MTSSGDAMHSPSAAVAAADTVDEESLQPRGKTSPSLVPKIEGVSLSYRFSLSVQVKSAKGEAEEKLLLDDACGTVAPGEVRQIVLSLLVLAAASASGHLDSVMVNDVECLFSLAPCNGHALY